MTDPKERKKLARGKKKLRFWQTRNNPEERQKLMAKFREKKLKNPNVEAEDELIGMDL